MKYIIGLIIGIVLMASWPQKMWHIFDDIFEYIELGIDKIYRQTDNS